MKNFINSLPMLALGICFNNHILIIINNKRCQAGDPPILKVIFKINLSLRIEYKFTVNISPMLRLVRHCCYEISKDRTHLSDMTIKNPMICLLYKEIICVYTAKLTGL